MATLEQLERGLIAADAAGNAEDARAFANAIRQARSSAAPAKVDTAEGMSTTEKVLTGIGGGLSKMRDQIFPPGNPINSLSMGTLGRDDTRERRDNLATYEANKADLGTAGAIGEAIPEVVATAAPISRAGTLISKAPVLARTLGRLAPAAGDIAANAGYAAATADEGNRGTSAMVGGAGAAGGRLLTRALGGVAKPFVSKDAQTLIDAGVTPTPGQLFGDNLPGRVVRATEDKAMSIPLAGDLIRNARTRSMEQYNNVEINRALAPLGKKVRGSGEDTIESAQRAISDAYDLALPQMFLTPAKATQALQATDAALKDIPLLTVEQEGKLIQYVARKIQPQLQSGKPIDGKTWKAIDAEIGHQAREFSTAADPSAHSLGEAFYALQQSWRDGLEATTPAAKSLLKEANSSYRQLLPSVKAADRAMGQGGRFTPLQFNRAAQKFGQDGSELNTAARRVLPASIPDSGTAGRALLGAGVIGGAATAGALGHTAGAAALTAVLYSRPGINFLLDGLGAAIPKSVSDALRALPPAQALERLATQYPHLQPMAQSVVSQLARQMATQSQGEQQ
ncbi:hypothetical protein QTH97_02275 [Variovorax sp. J22R24]|uniref:hypothetical protein n=1 Tax=Variovorax gracilis TaxID=3053502 RepID=UPI00257531EF|nr:hypothetical protein [Variovorax sp. J22R24]MDM0103743.1 hypothetical protein [Variovorax sp. J22R24]